MTPKDASDWLRNETPQHLSLMTRVREKLADTIETDVTEAGTPSRDWCRTHARYSAVYLGMLTEQRERMKMALAAKRDGQPLLDDAEYAEAERQLAIESLDTLPEDELHAAIERRRAQARPQELRAVAAEEGEDE